MSTTRRLAPGTRHRWRGRASNRSSPGWQPPAPRRHRTCSLPSTTASGTATTPMSLALRLRLSAAASRTVLPGLHRRQTGPGGLYVYDATPTSGSSPDLRELWSTKDKTDVVLNCTTCLNFCVSPFALPTVVQSKVYVPTYAISGSSTVCPTDNVTQPTYTSGLLVYGQ